MGDGTTLGEQIEKLLVESIQKHATATRHDLSFYNGEMVAYREALILIYMAANTERVIAELLVRDIITNAMAS